MPEISPSSRTGSSGGAALARASERATRGRAVRRAGSSGSAGSPLSDLEVVHRSMRRERQAVAERCDQEEAHGREEHERDERLGRRQNPRALQARAAVRGRPAPRGCVLAVAGRRTVGVSGSAASASWSSCSKTPAEWGDCGPAGSTASRSLLQSAEAPIEPFLALCRGLSAASAAACFPIAPPPGSTSNAAPWASSLELAIHRLRHQLAPNAPN